MDANVSATEAEEPSRPAAAVTLPPTVPLTDTEPAAFWSLRGRLWEVIDRGLLGSQLLVLPLLWSMVAEQEPWDLGPFGASWWVVLGTSVVGIGLFYHTARIFADLVRHVARGPAPVTLAVAFALDRRGEVEEIAMGRRGFAEISVADRWRLLKRHAAAAAAYLFAVAWLPIGFAGAVLMGTHGAIGPTALWLVTLGPTALALATGALLRWANRRARPAHPTEEVVPLVLRRSAPPSRWRVRAIRLSTAVLPVAVVSTLPLLPYVGLAALAPFWQDTVLARLGGVQERLVKTEYLRAYRGPLDPDADPTDAGAALHSLIMVGKEPPPGFSQPVRSYSDPFFPGDTLPQVAWRLSLFSRVQHMSSEERERVAKIAEHPAHAEVDRAAGAAAADLVTTRYHFPALEGVAGFDLPLPHYGSVRALPSARTALSVDRLLRGDTAGAERALQGALGVGFIMADNGVYILDALIGLLVVEATAEALDSFYTAIGDTVRLASLRSARDLTEAIRSRTAVFTSNEPEADALSTLEAHRRTATSAAALRGLRWEYYILFQTLSHCVNLHRAVFQPPPPAEWLQSIQRDLVRYSGEAQFFQRLSYGFLGTEAGPQLSLTGKLLGLLAGGSAPVASCFSTFQYIRATQPF